MNPYVNMAVVSAAIFVGAVAAYWNLHENALPIHWKLSILIAGLEPVAAYVIGRFQSTPKA